MTSLSRKLLRDILHLRGQMLAIASVIACGIAVFVSMQSVYRSLLTSQSDYYSEYRFADIFGQVKRAPESLRETISALDGVAVVQTRIVIDVQLDVPNLKEPATGRLVSIPEHRTPMLNDLFLRSGRYIEADKDDEVLVSETFATANNLQSGDTLGAILNGQWKQLRVVGVALSPEYVYQVRGAGSIFPDNKRFGVLWVNHSMLASAFSMQGAFNDVALTLARGADYQKIIDQLDKVLEKYGGFGSYDRSEQISNRFLSDKIKQNETQSKVTPTIFLSVAIFLLNIALQRLVSMQRDQIAILKAFGYSNVAIGWHFLQFALAVVALGMVAGIVLGYWLGSQLIQIYADFYQFPQLRYSMNLTLVLGSAFFGFIAAGLGALGAVRSAVSLPPAEAMRPESPPQFRTGIVERLSLQNFFSINFRMIFRNIERRPWKSSISVLMIALSVAILVVGRFMFDAVEFLMSAQFEIAQREDVMLVFNEPRSFSVRYDIAHLPGVLRQEMFTTIPVRLTAGYRTKRLAVIGVEQNTELRRLIDQHLNIHTMPAEGLVLTNKLAEILGVKPGDSLLVQSLEGTRRTASVLIASTVDELIGLSAYMNSDALRRILGDGETVSGTYLRVDANREEELYGVLKKTPAVGSVIIRKAMIESFNDTIAQSMNISTSVIIAFAFIISFGVVYNNVRIALSERGRELASLRVLGFTKAETSLILFGEQILLTLFAIPIGCALGTGLCALLPRAFETDLFRLPFVMTAKNFVYALTVITFVVIVTMLMIRKRLYSIDLISVLKTRE